jgi:ABC-type lipoprotein export system ATPase subunit
MDHDPIIKIEGLKKTFSVEGNNYNVLNGIDLEINATDFAIIYGSSGSGKSTLLHHIIGLEKPTSGKIRVRGTNLSDLNNEERAIFRAKKFGMVYQSPYWAKALTVLENVAMPLFIAGEDEGKSKDKALKALSEVGMDKYANKLPVQLSGGEQQRVGIARALVNNPWIIVADEPTGNLDTHNADSVMQVFQELNTQKKRTIIMVTHNLAYLPLANKTIAMSDGKVVTSSTDIKEKIREELKGVL